MLIIASISPGTTYIQPRTASRRFGFRGYTPLNFDLPTTSWEEGGTHCFVSPLVASLAVQERKPSCCFKRCLSRVA